MATYRSNRGIKIDMDQLSRANKNTVAVGNFNGQLINANGDIIDGKGRVLKKREEVVRETYREAPPQVKEISLKKSEPITFESPEEALKRFEVAKTEQKQSPRRGNRKSSIKEDSNE